MSVLATLLMLCSSLAAMSPAPSPEKADRKPPFWLGYATSAPQVKLISLCIPLDTGVPGILSVAGRFGVRAPEIAAETLRTSQMV